MTNPRWRALLPLAGGAALLVALAGGLLSPDRILATRDVLQFHLPLRATFARLLAHGLPEWNSWISGGQPVLSDPSYAAFYPLTWALILFPSAWAISLYALAHLAIATTGAWVLSRRLGCRTLAAALGATAYAAGGVTVSCASALTLLGGAAWLPWILTSTDAVRRAATGRQSLRAVCALAVTLALALLNGEPATALCGGLAAGAFALARRPDASARRAPGHLAAAALLAAGLAAIQWVPAVGRLAESDRADHLSIAQATHWSMPPARAGELLFPRLFGDAARADEGLWFGWGVHDQDFPFLPSVYPGLAVLLLALAGLAARPIPYRGAWLLMAAGGSLAALGRHTPVYEQLHRFVPPFGSLRYPEKFVLLVAAALAFASALTLERWLAEREAGRRGEGDLPVALAAVAAALAGGAFAFVRLAPESLAAWVAAHAGLPPGPQLLERALTLYRAESLAVLALSTATLALFVALRRTRPSAGPLAAALLLLVGVDLVIRHRGLLPTAPVAVLAPPPVARDLRHIPGRIFATTTFDRRPDLQALADAPRLRRMESRLARLEPWTGVIWGIPYALTEDFAVTFTAPVRRALRAAESLSTPQDSERFYRLLGAWAAAHTVVRTDPGQIARAIAGGEPLPAAATLRTNPWALPAVRYLAAAESFATAEEALAAALAAGLPLAEREFVVGGDWIGPGEFTQRRLFAGIEDRGDRIEIGLEPGGRTLLVIANTFDRDWSARVDGAPAKLLETAAGYQALVVPAGATRVRLEYRDPRVRAGAAVSLLALMVAALVWRRNAAGRRAAS
jgi:hypothetical protein